ncbi:hypothetical protein [Bifidobacterium castoris]|uniref:Uncharacterized protein n=1 Tax=Bifidobacterium castoris TaxID=2306972 RepID=A0A430F5W6_9BIFI|nr:hypothetical protein [Bifidobacterium castoris]MDE5641432.1 hypothetical protein [Bifidobacterium castoris]RSX47127.1 hypothetical protein D2E22_1311 [Bifidobacterium castoris]
MADEEKKEGLEALDAAQINELKEIVVETDHPHVDPVSGESDGNADDGFDKHVEDDEDAKEIKEEKKERTGAEESLLFNTANTWENMDEVPR